MNKIFKAHFFYKNNNAHKFIFLFIMMFIIQDVYNELLQTISLKITGTGKINIIGTDYKDIFPPSSVKINTNKQYKEDYIYDFLTTPNSVEISWSYDINNCKYMFSGCKNIYEINLTNFDISQVQSMSYMFNQCNSLCSLILPNFDYSNVNDMSYMFSNCESLISLDLSNFHNLNVFNMSNMFSNCTHIKSLDLSNFRTSNVNDMSYMFSNCKEITLLDLSNFDTSNVKDMSYMFSFCEQITSLDLSNFHTSNIYNMSNMFSNCGQITSLDLSNFDTSNVIDFDNMFDGCSKLDYIILKNFQEFKLNETMNFFNKVPNDTFVFGNESIILSKFNDENRMFYTIDCTNDSQSKRIAELNNKSCSCLDICNNNDNCCSNNFENFCLCKENKNLVCATVALELELCNKCNYNYPKENDTLNYENYKGCFNQTKNYYLDKIKITSKNCNFTCEECEIDNSRNPNTLKCNHNFSEITIDNYTNCYINCSFYNYLHNENGYQCVQNHFCSKEYSILSENKRECIKNNFNYLIQNITQVIKDNVNNNNALDKKTETEYYDDILKNVESIFTSENYDTSELDRGGNEIINIGKIKIILKAVNDSINYKKYNYTKLDLKECEDFLRYTNNISDNETLYLKQIEVEQEGFRVKKIEYDIYSRLLTLNLTKLNISLCKSKITITIPINISESLDILNISSGYYRDICYTTTTKSGTDIIIKDRQDEYKEGKKVICQEDCDFSSYDFKNNEANCSCYAKQSSSSFKHMNIDVDKIYKKFIDITNIANIKLLKCHHILFGKKGIIRNMAFYLVSILIIFHIFTISIFFYRLKNIIKDKIKDIAFAIHYWYLLNNEKIITIKRKKSSNKFFRYYLDDLLDKIDEKTPPNEIIKATDLNIGIINYKIKNKISHRVLNTQGMSKDEIIRRIKEIMAYNDEEMNNLSYNLALKIDKRKYYEYYLSLIKTNHIILFSFYNIKMDYNSKIIKINLFFVGFIVELFINALFFSDDTMHKIYVDEGKYNLLYQLVQIIYSTLISKVFSWLLNKFALSEGNILDFKQNKSKRHLNKRREKLEFWLRIRFILYFIISSIFIIFFWYYLSMFCAIYRNTQSHLITDTLLSFALSLLYPFIIYLLPGIFRIRALSDKEGKKKYIYNFSLFLQNICSIII